MRQRLTLAAAAAPLIAGIVLSGCSTSSGGGGAPIATARRAATTAPPAEPKAASPNETAFQRWVDGERAIARCIRKAGYEYPDPKPDGTLPPMPDFKGKVLSDPRLRRVLNACLKLAAPLPPTPKEADRLAAERREARCMRAHGLPDYPDPAPEDNSKQDLANAKILERVGHTPAYPRALRICTGDDITKGSG